MRGSAAGFVDAGEDAAIGQRDQAVGEVEVGIEIGLEPADEGFTGGKLASQARLPRLGQ